MPPLVTPALRRSVLAVVLVATLLVVALGALVWRGGGTGFDTWVYDRLLAHIGRFTEWRLMDATSPMASAGALVVVAAIAALARWWRLVAVAVVAPPVALGVTELLGKPLVGRTLSDVSGSFPSGHETGVASAALVLVLALGQLRLPGAFRLALTAFPAAWTVVAAVALVRGEYHYATDTIGALGVSAAVVLGTALLVDRIGPRVSSPDVRSRTRTSPAA